jgi:AraC-like DNA-binding protein
MDGKLREAQAGGLEGLCARGADRVRATGMRLAIGAGGEGIERLEAHFVGQAFAPHRHDTYAIGVTLSGVQTFRYRGERRHCLPGQCHILHPDETHDGGAGTDAGFRYRIIYIDPSLVQEALGGRPLPFLPDPVIRSTDFARELLSSVLDMEDPIDDVRRIEIAVAVAGMLDAASGNAARRTPLRIRSLRRVRDLIAASPEIRRALDELEGVAALDRWTLARQFRAAFGTSPSRFRTMRQLDRARGMMKAGMPLAEAALAAGFADQSHLSRMFKRAYGLTPRGWLAALAA